jgi:hypothetical protein
MGIKKRTTEYQYFCTCPEMRQTYKEWGGTRQTGGLAAGEAGLAFDNLGFLVVIDGSQN